MDMSMVSRILWACVAAVNVGGVILVWGELASLDGMRQTAEEAIVSSEAIFSSVDKECFVGIDDIDRLTGGAWSMEHTQIFVGYLTFIRCENSNMFKVEALRFGEDDRVLFRENRSEQSPN